MKDYKKVGIRVIYFKEQDIVMDSAGIEYEEEGDLNWGV